MSLTADELKAIEQRATLAKKAGEQTLAHRKGVGVTGPTPLHDLVDMADDVSALLTHAADLAQQLAEKDALVEAAYREGYLEHDNGCTEDRGALLIALSVDWNASTARAALGKYAETKETQP